MQLLTARWAFPVASPPIRDAAIGIHEGRIVAVGGRADVAALYPDARCWDLGEAALLPGLVNCHTHLEIGPLPSSAASDPFVSWLLRVIEHRRAIPPDELERTAEAGARALLRSGTTAVGEVTTAGRSLAPVLGMGLRGVVYREILGLDPAEATARAEAAREEIRAMRGTAFGGRIRISLSPHSAYALSEELLDACRDLVRETDAPPAIHAAESPDEVAFLSGGDGPIRRILYPAVRCADPPRRRPAETPIAYLAARGALDWKPLLIHAVYVNDEDCRTMVRHGIGVAHCPRSKARLSHGVAPVPLLLAHGIPVGLGTDSLASAPNLDLWDEMRAALTVHEGRLDPATVLEMGTLGGARVLDIADRVGSLEPGKHADVIAVSAGSVTAADPVPSLLSGVSGRDVLCSLIDGEVRYVQGEVPACV